MTRALVLSCLLATTALMLPLTARGDDAAPKAPARWIDTLTFNGQIEAGGTWNTSSPNDDRNFGRLYDDRSNNVSLNQVMLTVQRPIDSSLKTYDYGFKLQGFYGSDARYTHFPNELQTTPTNTLNQFDITEADLQVHTPWFTDGGFDIKAGQFPTIIGEESMDPSANYFYSHSYIFNFGTPDKHTGILTTLHAAPADIYLGVDSGVNTGLGNGDNNDSAAFLGGVGLTFMGGDLSIMASTHIGPEEVNNNSDMRALSAITTTWKATPKLTLITDTNWIHDDNLSAGHPANAFGIAQYGIYALDDVWSLTGRAEIFRDVNGVFVSQYGNNGDPLRSLQGLPATSPGTVGGGSTTYGAITAGLNIKPGWKIPAVSDLTLRPEVRYDTSLNDTHPFNDSSDRGMFTVGFDAIVKF